MYVEATLVTEGLNDNDDGFITDELWAAKATPVLKPMNWQHDDTQIIGVMFSAEARDLEGNILTEKPKKGIAYELVVQGAVWHFLPHLAEKAEEIKTRAAKGDLFVSMETWFDSYDYLVANDNGFDTVERNDKTIHLDKYLKANRGPGQFNDKRVGRALRGLIFGGIGFVDVPANKRSKILSVGNLEYNIETIVNNTVQEEIMAVEKTDIAPEIEKALEQRERVAAFNKAQADLAKAQNDSESLKAELADVKGKLQKSEAQSSVQLAALEAVLKSVATPEEIRRIDQAGSADEKFNAKLAWLADTKGKTDQAVKAENDALKVEVKALKADKRKQEVAGLFAGLGFKDEEVAKLVANAINLDDASYKLWLEEKTVFAARMKELEKAGSLEPMGGKEELDDKGAKLKDRKGIPSSVPSEPSKIAGSGNADLELDELVAELSEPDLGAATASGNEATRPMQKLVASLFADRNKKEEK
jgi:hypothetical protein